MYVPRLLYLPLPRAGSDSISEHAPKIKLSYLWLPSVTLFPIPECKGGRKKQLLIDLTPRTVLQQTVIH
ncbi:hypothetical protein E2C01_038582 [Portunus trituberculatus]|uniref:Uncharacterized protein n=1 Tax=Portunus trituberculatus TaxID=210409 RepID=A0A5B7FCL2_PORTR|nr:hypothetical protein [Portunus trituberculatus]